jgi:hypothetical protein
MIPDAKAQETNDVTLLCSWKFLNVRPKLNSLVNFSSIGCSLGLLYRAKNSVRFSNNFPVFIHHKQSCLWMSSMKTRFKGLFKWWNITKRRYHTFPWLKSLLATSLTTPKDNFVCDVWKRKYFLKTGRIFRRATAVWDCNLLNWNSNFHEQSFSIAVRFLVGTR